MRVKTEINDSGWFGKIPDGWRMVPLSSLFHFSKGLSITKSDLSDEGKAVVSYGQIHSKDNKCVETCESLLRFVPDDLAASSPSARVHPNGFVFADTSEDLDGCGANVRIDGYEDVYGGYHTVVLNPREDFRSKYLAYLFFTDAWRWQIRRDLVDVKLFSVSQASLKETYVVVPPESAQEKIVSYLDERCAAIDEDVAKRREVIGKLKEYKKSLIAHAVTKGLDPTAEMKDSGVEWIGKIPKSWEVQYPKALFALRNERMREEDIQLTASQEYGVVPQKEFQEREGRRVVQVILNPEILKHVEPGDFVMHMRSFQGGLEIAERSGCISSAYVMLHARNDKVRLGYFRYLFKSSTYIDALRSTSNLIRDGQALRYANFIQVYLPLPPADVQDAIASYLDERCAAIDEAITRQEQLIDKLGEYRKSIIHHAVTGKIDCTEG